MKNKDKNKITIQKHYAEQFVLPIITQLPPKWKVLENSNKTFDFYNEKGEIVLENKEDTEIMRKFCWNIYNKITN